MGAQTHHLADLVQPDATYRPSPWAEPLHGLDQIARFRECERDGADEELTMVSDVVAVDSEIAHLPFARTASVPGSQARGASGEAVGEPGLPVVRCGSRHARRVPGEAMWRLRVDPEIDLASRRGEPGSHGEVVLEQDV
jgi:hypothetical protein